MDLPSTRYYGSKRRIVHKIWDALQEEHIEFDSLLDLFGGTAIVSYFMLKKGKKVFYNDVLLFNCINARALLATPKGIFTKQDALSMLTPQKGTIYKNIIAKNFRNVYFTDSENKQLDIIVQNVNQMNEEQQCCGFYVMSQACLIKRPFNIFHRNNLYLRLNHKRSNFGNFVTWEKSFQSLFTHFADELNHYQFENPGNIVISNESALTCHQTADIVYIDPPYFNKSSSITYHTRYHFLEGLTHYELIEDYINKKKKNKEIQINKNLEFEQKTCFVQQLSDLFAKYKDSIIAMSYTTNGYPSIDEIVKIMSQYKEYVVVKNLGHIAFALNKNNGTREEVLIIGK